MTAPAAPISSTSPATAARPRGATRRSSFATGVASSRRSASSTATRLPASATPAASR